MAKRAAKEKKEKPKKERKTKQKKDKNAPKRAISAFFFYQKERRDPLKKEQPGLDNKQLISKMSEEWNNMSDSQRVQFNKLAEADKGRYEKQKKEYEKTKGSTSNAKASTGKSTSKKAKKVASESEEENNEEDGEE